MSITISIAGERISDWDDEAELSAKIVNLSNVNASDVLGVLGYSLEPDPCGQARARELADRCRRALGQPLHDTAIAPEESGGPGTGQCRLISFGRAEGYIQERIEQILCLCERAGQLGMITWG